MATERLSMRKTREILRQKWQLGRTHRATASSLGTSAGAVGAVLARASAAGLTTWANVEALTEEELERRLYGPREVREGGRAEPDCTWIHRERTRPGVTLQLLHVEYLEKHPGGYQYTAFCDRFREWCARRGLVMRHVHVAGEKLFVDYSGKRPSIVDRATGEVIPVELFARIRNEVFHSLATLNARIRDLLVDLNARVMRRWSIVFLCPPCAAHISLRFCWSRSRCKRRAPPNGPISRPSRAGRTMFRQHRRLRQPVIRAPASSPLHRSPHRWRRRFGSSGFAALSIGATGPARSTRIAFTCVESAGRLGFRRPAGGTPRPGAYVQLSMMGRETFSTIA